MVDAIDAWVDVIFFAVAAASSATAPAELKFRKIHEKISATKANLSSAGAVAEEAVLLQRKG